MRSHAILLILTGLSVLNPSGKAQPPEPGLRFWPTGLQFHPLAANHEEPRVGAQMEFDPERLTVALGNFLDVMELKSDGNSIRFGLDFFAYARVQRFGEGELNIDAADGFFGFHFTYTRTPQWQFRLRGLHYSAHLVDGNYDFSKKVWSPTRNPFPFSRNYFELTCAFQLNSVSQFSRAYAGPGFALFNMPEDIRPFQALAGIELVSEFDPHVYSAYHVSLLGIPTYNLSNSVELGVKFGRWDRAGLRFFITYANGLGWFGQYYDERKEVWGTGLMIDFW